MSQRYTFNKADGTKILKVLGWTVASAVVGFVVATLPMIDVPVKYAAMVSAVLPLVNTGLYSLQKFLENKIEE